MEKKIRMADIAEALGVSVVSVSKALSGKEGVGDEMRARIIELAKEMGYVPLRSKPQEKTSLGSGNIGILGEDMYFADNTFYSNLYRQVLMCCKKCGYSALLDLVTKEAERERTVPAMIAEGKVDGLIFIGEIDRDYLRTLVKSGLPYLLLDFYDEELDACSVTSDNTSGGYLMTKHLLDRGWKRIGFVGSINATSSIMDRFLGYSKALMKAGIPLRSEWILEDRDQAGAYVPLKFPEEMPDAFFCNCDEVAYNLVARLKKEGYRVPEDIAVVGYDDHYYAQLCAPQLTTYRVNVEDMGKVVVNQLISRIRGENTATGNTVIRGRFVQRESTK